MRITKLNIISFGKHKNKEISLDKDNNLNVIYGENEAGKSTIAAFIKFMLFGFVKERSSKTNNKPLIREKYIPWDNSNISGNLYCEYKGQSIVIERTQKSDGKGGTKKVYNEATGEELEEFKGVEPGTIFYKVDLETYENTAFLLQDQLAAKSTDEMDKRFRNIATTGNDETSYEKASEYINVKLKEIGSNKSGKIRELMKKLEPLEEEYQTSEGVQNSILTLEKERIKVNENLKIESENLEKLQKQKDNSKAMSAKQKLDEIAAKKAEIDLLIAENEKVANELNKKDITRENIEFVKNNLVKFEIAAASEKNSGNSRARLEQELKAEQEKLNKYKEFTANEKEIKEKLKKTAKQSYKIIAIALTIAMLVIAPFTMYISIAVGVIIFMITVYLFNSGLTKKDFKKLGIKTTDEINATFLEIEKIKENIERLEQSINLYSKTEESSQDIADKIADYLKIEIFSVNSVKNIISVFSNTLDKFEKQSLEIEKLKANLNGLVSGVSVEELQKIYSENSKVEKSPEINGENATFGLAPEIKEDISLTELENKIQDKTAKVNALNMESQRIIQNLKFYSDSSSTPSEVLSKISAVKQEIEKLTETAKEYSLALEMLDRAYQTMQSVFAPEISKKAEQYFNNFTNDTERKLLFSKNGDITVSTNNQTHHLDYFSKGATDAIYTAFRMAVCDIIYENEKPILVFDDTFSNFDDKRLALSLTTLRTLSKDFQILYLTCKKIKLLDANEINTINL
ncbi:MAG: AAA family ATPase [Clostridia bacterium]